MQNKLYVGGIPYSTTQDELRAAFAQAGNVASATIITDKMTGRSRGFGFVEMSSADEANRAIEVWNGKELGGRTLLVSLARPQERNDRFSR
jgi:RNA recognition motif-containing protein